MTGQLGWTGDNGDPDNFFFLRGCAAARAGGQNLSKWCNKDFDDLLDKARTTRRHDGAHQAVRGDAGDRERGGA